MTVETAETIAAQGLAFLAEDPALLSRFLTLTGIELADLRAQAGAPQLLASVLNYIANDESLLLVFTANTSIAPESIVPALHVLEGPRPS